MIQEALKYAEQNPESAYANELRRRIESGMLDNELSQAGLEYKKGVGITQKTSTLQKVIDTAGEIAGVSNIGRGFGQALTQRKTARGLEQAQTQATDIQTELLSRIKDKKARGEDTSRLEGALQDIGGNIQEIGSTTEQALNPEDISGKKVAGDIIQIGSFAFPYGKVASTAGKAVGKTAGAITSGLTGGFIADIGFNLQNDKEGADIFKPGAATVIGGAIPVIGAGIGAATRAGRKVVDTEKTLGQILQSKSGQKRNAQLAQQAFSQIDTTGVKTFKELSDKLDEAMTIQMQKVDEALSKDSNIYTLDDFALRTKDTAGNEVRTDVVGEALKNLDELYTTTADNTAAQNVRLLAQKAVEEGLTRQEVNNIARLYSSEFGSKGFSKLGDPLTSVNAQKFQNIQKGLKTVARGGLGFGEEAKLADELYSAMRNTKTLIDKNADAVDALRQRVQDSGLLEKLTRGAVRTLDTLSGGTLRGTVGALFPSNVGLKTLNYLDIENNLAKNLQLLQKAQKAKTDSQIIKLLNGIKFPGDVLIDNTKPYIEAAKKNLKNPKNAQGGFINMDGLNIKQKRLEKTNIEQDFRDYWEGKLQLNEQELLDRKLVEKVGNKYKVNYSDGSSWEFYSKFPALQDAREDYIKNLPKMIKKDIPKATNSDILERDIKVFRAPQNTNDFQYSTGIYTTPQKDYADIYARVSNSKVEEMVIPTGSKILEASDIDTLYAQMYGTTIKNPEGTHSAWIEALRKAEQKVAKRAKSLGYDVIHFAKENYDYNYSDKTGNIAESYVLLQKPKSKQKEVLKKANK